MDAKWFHNVSDGHKIRVPQRSDFVRMGDILIMKDYVKNGYGTDASNINHYEAMTAAAFFGYRLPTITELAIAFHENEDIRKSMLEGNDPNIRTVDSEWTCDVYVADETTEHVLRKPAVKKVAGRFHPEGKFAYEGGRKIDVKIPETYYTAGASRILSLKKLGPASQDDSETSDRSIRFRPSRGPISPVLRRGWGMYPLTDMIEAEAWSGPETTRNYIGYRFVKEASV